MARWMRLLRAIHFRASSREDVIAWVAFFYPYLLYNSRAVRDGKKHHRFLSSALASC
jgi:hypothetical protein